MKQEKLTKEFGVQCVFASLELLACAGLLYYSRVFAIECAACNYSYLYLAAAQFIQAFLILLLGIKRYQMPRTLTWLFLSLGSAFCIYNIIHDCNVDAESNAALSAAIANMFIAITICTCLFCGNYVDLEYRVSDCETPRDAVSLRPKSPAISPTMVAFEIEDTPRRRTDTVPLD
mmetsp:Transcript_5339/g.9792  ORF Transcript_5339/g.9792 Transcript_5339/m.9792 type:complete len:175 (-) Transcript_5339:86-610(-)|eukprot:CAMPEP_0204906600 /NCGR_PEP_ID=MMETSP1397-20131031/6064_1 /ASSEMBLY_ACC=CAM_ASM_000891 /TAXON_ID=49980 /ORGANISM="Climacostomum Climacostomum virens, Strain Stock W-24" /LENGTH=174 /DNA_ID=CAMNT_0052075601 /DNA_START=117 /DNA_END=641 /DNA_ORIENTATION=-